MSDDFYVRLAGRLRVVHRLRADRVERERAAKDADPGKIALDDVLDVLHDDAARPHVDAFAARLREAVVEASRRPAEPYAVGTFRVPLADPFLDRALDYYRDQLESKIDPARLPQAVVNAFARFAADDGYLDVDEVAAKGDPAARALLDAVLDARAAPDRRPSSPDGSAKRTGKYAGLSSTVAARVALSKRRDSYAARMPVVADLMAALAGRPLQGFGAASVQHLFPSSIALYDALYALGADPEQTWIGGKYYSANPNTVAYMDARGMRVAMSATEIDDDVVDAEAGVKQDARAQLRMLFRGVDPKQETQPRFLLLDDGGKLIQALHEDPKLRRFAHLCVAVEQTTRGLQVMDDMARRGIDLLCPVVDMASADLKRRFESPLIAESIAWHVERSIEELALTPPKTVVVAGFGATGAAVAEAWRRRGVRVVVTDVDPAKIQAAKDAGYEAGPRDEVLPQAEVFIGCTGRGSLSRDDWSLLPSGALLVNGASGNHELGVASLGWQELDGLDPARRVDDDGRITTTFGGRDVALGRSTDDARLAHRVVRTPNGREALLLRGGSVVNMEHDLPPEYRQVIVAMLIASCAQAAAATAPGRQVLDVDMQAFLLSRFRRALDAAGLPLDPPDFDAIARAGLPFG